MTARWAILGAGAISRDFADGLSHASLGHLHAVGARSASDARAFADAHGAPVAGTYDEILERDDVDAVYIGTVHTTHGELAIAALEAGKAVLCEKPLTTSAVDTDAVLAVAARTGLPLVEAFKYRFGPFPDLLRRVVGDGTIGDIVEVVTTIGFTATERTGRLFDPAVAGGAILDAGCYPVSLAVGVAAWAGQSLDDARVTSAEGLIGDTGVDETASAVLQLGAVTARVRTAIVEDLPRSARIVGTTGEIEVPNVWGSRQQSTEAAVLRRLDGSVEHLTAATLNPMAAEADAVIAALRDGRAEAPEMPWAQTRIIARLLEDWRRALD